MLAVMAASRAARLAGEVRLHRHDDAEGDAARGRDGDLLKGRELLAHALEEARLKAELLQKVAFDRCGRRGRPLR
jgi:hypothetical protein